MLAQFERMMERARASAAGMCGAIRVGYIIGAAVDIVPRVLRAHAEQCPDVQVQTTEFDFSRPAAGLDNGCSDVAIVRPPIDVRGAQLRTLATEPRVACLPESHRLAERDEVSVYELLDEPIIAAPGHGPWRDYWLCCEYRGAASRLLSARPRRSRASSRPSPAAGGSASQPTRRRASRRALACGSRASRTHRHARWPSRCHPIRHPPRACSPRSPSPRATRKLGLNRHRKVIPFAPPTRRSLRRTLVGQR